MRPSDDFDELQSDATLRAFADEVRAYASAPPPKVRADLASVLAGGMGRHAPAYEPAWERPLQGASRRLRNRLQGRRGRVALGLSVLSLTMLGTGGAGALPGPAQAAFERAAEVAGIELPAATGRAQTPGPSDPEPEAPAEIGTPDGRSGPAPGGNVPRPGDESQPGPSPVEPGRPSDGAPPGLGGSLPTEPGRDAPGEIGREAEERIPGHTPGTVVPARPGPPDDLPAGPPEDGLVDGADGGSDDAERDGDGDVRRDVGDGEGEGEQGSRPTTTLPLGPAPAGRPVS